MELMRQMLAAVAVLAAAGLLAWLLRRGGRLAATPVFGRAGKRLQLLERLALGPQHSLHLVRLEDRALLIAISPAGCTVLEHAGCGALENSEAGRKAI